MNTFPLIVLHLAVVIFAAPLLQGMVTRTKAIVAGRKGPPLFQLYFDIWKLLRKQMVISCTTSWIFLAAPALAFSAVVLASLLVPLAFSVAPLSFGGDIILYLYLFAGARICTVLAALDTGSAFEGMGGVREVSYATFAEGAAAMLFVVLARICGTFSLSDALHTPLDHDPLWYGTALALVAFCWFVLLLVENCRIPFDDPTTHLELTMVHEVMVLDHSGPALGMILWGAAIKLFLSLTIFVAILAPREWSASEFAWPLYAISLLAGAVLVGFVESFTARLKLTAIPKVLLATCLLSTVAFLFILR